MGYAFSQDVTNARYNSNSWSFTLLRRSINAYFQAINVKEIYSICLTNERILKESSRCP